MSETEPFERQNDPSNEEIGDFAEGQETTHHVQRPHRFSEGEETMPDSELDNYVGDFAEGQETVHQHHTGGFAEGQAEDDRT